MQACVPTQKETPSCTYDTYTPVPTQQQPFATRAPYVSPAHCLPDQLELLSSYSMDEEPVCKPIEPSSHRTVNDFRKGYDPSDYPDLNMSYDVAARHSDPSHFATALDNTLTRPQLWSDPSREQVIDSASEIYQSTAPGWEDYFQTFPNGSSAYKASGNIQYEYPATYKTINQKKSYRRRRTQDLARDFERYVIIDATLKKTIQEKARLDIILYLEDLLPYVTVSRPPERSAFTEGQLRPVMKFIDDTEMQQHDIGIDFKNQDWLDGRKEWDSTRQQKIPTESEQRSLDKAVKQGVPLETAKGTMRGRRYKEARKLSEEAEGDTEANQARAATRTAANKEAKRRYRKKESMSR